MTAVQKRSAFRNDRDDATIVVEQYIDSSCRQFMWRYFVKYDSHNGMTSGLSDGLWHRPSRKWLKSRF